VLNIDPIPADKNMLPDVVQDALAPDAPGEQRLLLARAVIPLGPAELVSTLTYLLDDKSEKVSTAATTTLNELPWGVLSSGIREVKDPGVLDSLARLMLDREDVINQILGSESVSTRTVTFVASRGKGVLLERIAANQVMLSREPQIIEALYYNPETRMGTISTVLEFAVRSEIDLSHIPGYKEIVDSIFGGEAEKRAKKEKEAEDEAPQPPLGAPPTEEKKDFASAMADAAGTVLDAGDADGFLDDEAFSMVLQAAAWEEGPEDEEEEEEDKTALWARVHKMNVVQKVRLALLGNDFIRSLLIRDSRRIVFMAVLRSPKTSEKEVIAYAKDKALDDEIIRTISRNRDWTKLYAVRQALIQNPKTSPSVAMNFLKTMHPRDLRNLSHNHDIPGYVMKAAKRLVAQREQGVRS